MKIIMISEEKLDELVNAHLATMEMDSLKEERMHLNSGRHDDKWLSYRSVLYTMCGLRDAIKKAAL